MSENTSREILIALTVDTDGDQYFGDHLSCRSLDDKTIQGWTGLEIGKDIIVEGIEGITDSYGKRAPLTWFIRCDRQVREQYRDYLYLLNEYRDWWELRVKAGDDVQWHAHVCRLENGRWIQETDIKNIRKDLREGKESLERYGLFPKAVRIGESYHSNELTAVISELSLKVDSTALPGRKRRDEEKSFDWKITPNHPYHPSMRDYRVEGEPAYSHWEIPMNTVCTQVSYDKLPIWRYVNLAFHPGILDSGLATFFKEYDVLVSITHPFELVSQFFQDGQMAHHPLISFDSSSVRRNLQAILSASERVGKKVRFVTMTELLERLEAS